MTKLKYYLRIIRICIPRVLAYQYINMYVCMCIYIYICSNHHSAKLYIYTIVLRIASRAYYREGCVVYGIDHARPMAWYLEHKKSNAGTHSPLKGSHECSFGPSYIVTNKKYETMHRRVRC